VLCTLRLAMAGGVAATSVEWPGSFVRLPGLRGYLSAHWDLELVVDLVFLVFGGVANCVIMLIVLQWRIGLMPICVYFSLPWLRPTIAAFCYVVGLGYSPKSCRTICVHSRSCYLFQCCIVLLYSCWWWDPLLCLGFVYGVHYFGGPIVVSYVLVPIFTTSVVHFVLDHHSCQLS